MLKSLSIPFTWQKAFDWSGKSRYDFYIDDLSVIIEPGGLQHIIGWGRDKDDADRNNVKDRIKKENALKNGIKHYIFFISDSNFSQIKKRNSKCS